MTKEKTHKKIYKMLSLEEGSYLTYDFLFKTFGLKSSFNDEYLNQHLFNASNGRAIYINSNTIREIIINYIIHSGWDLISVSGDFRHLIYHFIKEE